MFDYFKKLESIFKKILLDTQENLIARNSLKKILLDILVENSYYSKHYVDKIISFKISNTSIKILKVIPNTEIELNFD